MHRCILRTVELVDLRTLDVRICAQRLMLTLRNIKSDSRICTNQEVVYADRWLIARARKTVAATASFRSILDSTPSKFIRLLAACRQIIIVAAHFLAI